MFRHSIYCRRSFFPATSLFSPSSTSSSSNENDPYNIRNRFIAQQSLHFRTALNEIRAGQKRGCWSWFIFVTPPFIDPTTGIERGSPMNRSYALRDLPPNTHVGFDAARAFLTFPTTDGVNLRNNYLEMMTAVADQLEMSGVHPVELVGMLDVDKLVSSLKLMQSVSGGGSGSGKDFGFEHDHDDPEVYQVCKRCLKLMGEN